MSKLLALTLAAAALAPAATAADGPKADLFGGYSYLKADEKARHGWQAALGWNVWGKLGLVADLSGQYRNEDGITHDTFSYMGGARFSLHGNTLTPFLQVLAGGVNAKEGISVLDFSGGETHTSFGWAAGGGLEFKIASHWAVRVQADYFNFEPRKDASSSGNLRAAAGVAYRFLR
jgi:opacity protein-like surface antigen